MTTDSTVKKTLKTTAKALILRQDAALLLKKRYEDRVRYTLAGGTQEPGESLVEALQRECLEEIGTEVDVGPLRYVHEFEKPASKNPGKVRHKIEFIFECRVPEAYQPTLGHRPDSRQVGTGWVHRSLMDDIDLTPERLRPILMDAFDGMAQTGYLGKAG